MLPAGHSPKNASAQDMLEKPIKSAGDRNAADGHPLSESLVIADEAECSLEKIFDDSEPIIEPLVEEPS